jgi:hypothetical protein
MYKHDPSTPLVALKSWLLARVDKGERCPVCNQYAKVYKRKLNSGMAVSLVRMYKAAGLGWVHIPTVVGSRSREEGKLRYWGLVEEELEKRPDGGRSGYWRVTPLGELFIQGKASLYSHARIYDGRCLGLTGDQITIKDALTEKFDLDELMGT